MVLKRRKTNQYQDVKQNLSSSNYTNMEIYVGFDVLHFKSRHVTFEQVLTLKITCILEPNGTTLFLTFAPQPNHQISILSFHKELERARTKLFNKSSLSQLARMDFSDNLKMKRQQTSIKERTRQN